jgi:pimeloyl-ACP methyl ester carboxylesterase
VGVVHRRDELAELPAHVVGVTPSFGHVAPDPTFEPDVLRYVDEHGVVEEVVDAGKAEQQDSFDQDDLAGLDVDRRTGAGVGREVVLGNVNVTPRAEVGEMLGEQFVVERVGVVVVDLHPFLHRDVGEVVVVGVERQSGHPIDAEAADHLHRQGCLPRAGASADPDECGHGRTPYIAEFRDRISAMTGSEVTRHTMTSALVTSPLVYELLTPDGLPPGAPVLLWLHGGDGPDRFASLTQPAFESCWADGTLPPLSVVIPHSSRSFWLDGVGERSAWESMLIEELLPHVQKVHGNGLAVVGGISMGAMGALRAAFRHPDVFAAVVALEPAIEPTAEWREVTRRDRFYGRDDVVQTLYGDPVDAEMFRSNHPLEMAVRHGVEIAAADLAIYVECGDEDMLNLHHGAEALHRRLWDLGLVHEYRSVRGGNHVGRTLGPRVADALGFVGRSLSDDAADPVLDVITAGLQDVHEAGGFRRQRTVEGPAGPIDVWEYGEGAPVVMLPSLGRGAADFDDLARRLARAGYHAIHPEPRGIGGSSADLGGLTMADLAADVAAVIHAVTTDPVTLVGHAFGNRVARMTATDYPHLVDSVVLLCCGGLVKPAAEHSQALLRVFDLDRPARERLAAVAQAFFAPGNDPAVWADGWFADVAAAQGAATAAQPIEHWWGAGGKEVFVVQPVDDVMAVPENAHRICDEFGERASMVTVPRAGHALLPEQPDAVEVAVRTWLTRAR